MNTSKPGDVASFFPCQRFDLGAPATFDQLRGRRIRPGMPRDEFVVKLTATYDEINHLHLFRDGNGRAQRIFLSQLAQHAGFGIDWQQVDSARNDQVCRAAGHGNTEPMKEMLEAVVVTDPARRQDSIQQPGRESHPNRGTQVQPQTPASQRRLPDVGNGPHNIVER